MQKSIKIGNLALNMGAVGHAVGHSKALSQRSLYLMYITYQFKVEVAS